MADLRPNSIDAIGERLRLIRIAYGILNGHNDELSQVDFAQLCGISRQMWNNAERKRARLGLDNAMLLRERTGATLDYIYEGDRRGLPLALALEIEKLEKTEKHTLKRA